VKYALLNEILYLFIRMVKKKTLVIIDAYHIPTFNKTVSNILLSRLILYVDEITGDDQCEL
jgi:hypothetical protein